MGKEDKNLLWLLYDGECPICNSYVHKVRIEQSIGKLVLVNARQNSDILQEVLKNNIDIDNGMVLKFKDVLYYGSDAINMLAILGTRSGLFNRFNYYVFGNEFLARALYPVCRTLRNILLFILRIPKINVKNSE